MKTVLFFLFIGMLFLFGCEENATEPVQSDKPFVEIVEPENNASFGDSLFIKVKATDDKGIVQVEIYIDNQTNFSRTFYVEPYEYLWLPYFEPDSTRHKIYAKAYDGDDNVTSSVVIDVYHVRFPPPTNLNISSISETTLELRWENSLNYAEGFIVERKRVGSYYYTFEKIGETDSLRFIDTGIEKEKKYSYRVKAFRGADTTGYSEEIFVEYKTEYGIYNNFTQPGSVYNVVNPVARTPDDNSFIYAYQNSNDFYIYDLPSNRHQLKGSVGFSSDYITNISLYAQGRALLATEKGNVFVKNYPSFQDVATFLFDEGPITGVCFLGVPDLFAAAAKNGKIIIADADQQQILASYDNPESSGNVLIAYDPEADILISASQSGYMSFYNVTQNEIVNTQYLGNPITAIQFYAHNNALYIGQNNGVIKTWNVASNVLADSFSTSIGKITDIEISQNGEMICAAGLDNVVRLWKTGTQKVFATLNDVGIPGGPISVASLKNMEYVMTGSRDKIFVWKLLYDGWVRL